MRILNSVIKNRFGEYYKLQSPREISIELKLNSKSFWNDGSIQQFINNLIVPNGYWNDILYQYSTLPLPSSLSCCEVEKLVASLVLQNEISFYTVDIPDASERPPENRVIKSQDKILYHFVPMSTLLLTNDANSKTFKSKEEVREFISGLNPDDKKLATIASDLKISLPNTTSVNRDEIIDSISEAIISAKVAIIADKISSPPPDTSKVEEVKSTVGNRRADIIKAEEDEFKEINIELIDEFNKSATEFYKLFDNLEFKIKTDKGEEHKGKITNGKIHVVKAKMSSTFELEIKDLPAFMEA